MTAASESLAEARAAALAARAARRAARRAEAQVHRHRAARLRRFERVDQALRLVLFALLALALARAPGGEGGPGPWIAPAAALVAFLAVVAHHRRVRSASARARRAGLLAAESAARLDGATGPGAGGALPVTPVSDLDAGAAVHRPEARAIPLATWALEDLGVEGSAPTLFDALDTTQTLLGARRLRRILRHPLLDAAAIVARQEVVRELARERARRDALLLAYAACRGAPLGRVPAFLATPRVLGSAALRAGILLCGVATPIAASLATTIPVCVAVAAAGLAASVALHFAVRRAAPALRASYLELEPLVCLAREVEPLLAAWEPRSALLAELGRTLQRCAGPRSGLRGAAVALRCLHLHEAGLLYGIVEILTLWDLQWLIFLEGRLKRDAEHATRLVGALADLEAQLAIAVWADEQPGVVFPEILGGPPQLDITAGEHPLLPLGRAVENDIALGGNARLALVTGSNMAGKSTFLRMVALDVLLAQIGAPVRAQALRLTPFELRANINVRDSLADGKSYFLVEVERVQEILAAARARPHVLGVFDELFRGTNSTERLAASREIARHLAGLGGLFLLATHDQELARLASEGVPGVVALHFRDEIEAGRMVFPYRVEPGVARTHNALRLLEMAGYPEEIVERARAFAAARGFGD